MNSKKALLLILTIMLLLQSCGKSNTNEPHDSTSANIEETITDTIADTEEPLNQNQSIYGYYEVDDKFINISEKYYEEKDIDSGLIIQSLIVDEIQESKSDDGITEYVIIFYRDSPERITLFRQHDGSLKDSFSSLYISIDESKYNSVPSVYNVDTDDSLDYVDNYIPQVPWYEQEFQTYTVIDNLRSIDNLFAVGKTSEAEAMINEKIFGDIDNKVHEYLANREYFLAQNYVSMYEMYLGTYDYLYSSNRYNFLKQYLNDKYHNYNDGKNTYRIEGIAAPLQDYYGKIYEAAIKDVDVISREESLYLLNQELLNNGYSAVTNLFYKSGFFIYRYDIVDNTGSTLEFIFVDPYLQKVYSMPREYGFFFDAIIIPTYSR